MHGLFFMSDSVALEGVENPSIHIFGTEYEANAWLLRKLISAGRVEMRPGDAPGYWYDDLRFESMESLLDAVRDRHGSLEFLDVFPAVDHR